MPLRHKNLYHTISEKQFEDEVADLYENLPGMSVAEAKVGFLRIVTSIGDAHTWISSMVDSPVLPIIHSQFGNDIYAVAAKQGYEAIG